MRMVHINRVGVFLLVTLGVIVLTLLLYVVIARIVVLQRIKREARNEQICGRLLRAISHDLRTPLTSIVGITSALAENGGIFNEEQKNKLLAESRDEAQRLMDTVENLLVIAQIDGKTEISKSEEIIEEVIGETIVKLRKRFPGAKVELDLAESPMSVPMDAMLISQVLVNLLANAMTHGQPAVVIGAEPQDTRGESPGQDSSTDKCELQAGAYNQLGKVRLQIRSCEAGVEFCIYDNGPGFTAERLAQIGKSHFFSYKLLHSESNEGMGIGFPVCYAVVQAHGGSIRVENRTEGGAVVSFTLPAKAGAEP